LKGLDAFHTNVYEFGVYAAQVKTYTSFYLLTSSSITESRKKNQPIHAQNIQSLLEMGGAT
jgi:hypothetical protein